MLADVDKEYVSIFSKLRRSNNKLMTKEGRFNNLELNVENAHFVNVI